MALDHDDYDPRYWTMASAAFHHAWSTAEREKERQRRDPRIVMHQRRQRRMRQIALLWALKKGLLDEEAPSQSRGETPTGV